MSWWGIGAAVVSAVASAASSYQQGQVAKQRADAASKAEEYNRMVATNKATNTRALYDQKEESTRRVNRMKMGEIRARGAQSGTGTDGSTADMEQQSAVNAEMEALNVRYQGHLQSTDLLNGATLSGVNAENYTIAGQQAETSGNIGAGAALLQGAAKYYSTSKKTPAAGAAKPTVED